MAMGGSETEMEAAYRQRERAKSVRDRDRSGRDVEC